MMHNRKLMERASFKLMPVNSYQNGLPLYFLTGEKYLYQTLFCIQSLIQQSTDKFEFILVDDGSFTNKLIKQINTQLPGARVVTQAEIDSNLQRILPENSYPVLWRKRREYPHIKKLTDIHTLQGGAWKLVLDSDMLFYDNPLALINWLKKPGKPLHMVDCTQSYGYSGELMEGLAASKIPALLNVGAIGLDSGTINWEKLEAWVKILEEKEGKTYYLEQALSAMLIGDEPCTILNAAKYIVNPGDAAIENNTGVLHHYVDLSKKGYYNKAWKKIVS
jgi:glycosyltransferase involved in cell wall biosynthesis